jgi:predicted kinase
MTAIANRLAAFHAVAATSEEISTYGTVAAVRRNTDENFDQTLPYIDRTIKRANHESLRSFTGNYCREHAPLFEARVRDRRIRDCHGDLHAAHICMGDEICIFDCIEFNDRFRYGDVASEVAFLAMDLDRLTRQDLSRDFCLSYAQASGDAEVSDILPFYKCYRAFVRGKVEGFKLGDDLVPVQEKASALRLARCYFELARRYATRQGLLVIMSGLTGSGKSTIASALAALLAGRVISSDAVRKELAGIPLDEHRYVPYGSGIYSPERTRQTYEEMLRRAGPVLQAGGCAILDAAFLRGEERRRARDAALRHGSRAVVVECAAPHDVMLRRLEERRAGFSVSDGRAEILERQLPDVEAIAEFAEENHLRVDASRSPDEILEEIWRRL